MLTPLEFKVLDLLNEATRQYLDLPQQHPSDATEWRNTLHLLQEKVMIRAAVRAYPAYFNSLENKPATEVKGPRLTVTIQCMQCGKPVDPTCVLVEQDFITGAYRRIVLCHGEKEVKTLVDIVNSTSPPPEDLRPFITQPAFANKV